MPTTLPSYPFSETPGKIIGHGYSSIVRELGPDWVIKEFNPLKPDGTPKKAEEIALSQNPQHIKELQETQRILSQGIIYGSKIIPTHWVLGKDENGNEKYFTIQKRFIGETLPYLQGPKRFYSFFNEHSDLKQQMLELIWGSKRVLVETGVCDDLHMGNIALVDKDGNFPKLILFDVPNLIRLQKIIYGEPPASKEAKIFILDNMEKRLERLQKYEQGLDITEEEKLALDQKFEIESSKYSDIVRNLLQMKEQLS